MDPNEKKDGTTVTPPPAAGPAPTAPPVPEEKPKVTPQQKLQELGVAPEIVTKIIDLGVESVEDLSGLGEADLVGVGMKPLVARKLLKALAGLKPAAPVVAEAAVSAAAAASFDKMLPEVPNDTSWLESLKAGGVLKVEQSTVISAIRAALGHRVGLYDIPDKLVEKMEQFAETAEEQVGTEFFGLRKQLTRKNYAEIFEAVPGMDGSFVTESRKKQLFARIDEHLWPAIIGFNGQLQSWQDAWMKGAANPGMMMAAMVAMGGGGGGVMPPGMMQPPDTGTIRDTADAVNNAANKVFSGVGVQIAAALAFEATKIRETLANSRLPALIGVPNRDQMLRELGVAVSATYPRLELNLTRFVLAILNVKNVSQGNEELQYFGALFMLGSQIPWDQLGCGSSGVRRPSGVGVRERL